MNHGCCFALSDAINMQIQQEYGIKVATLISLLHRGYLETMLSDLQVMESS
jgi:hypothetical protein